MGQVFSGVGEALWEEWTDHEVSAASVSGKSGGLWPGGFEQVPGSREAGTLGNKTARPPARLVSPWLTQ